jgi:uncharacterized protein
MFRCLEISFHYNLSYCKDLQIFTCLGTRPALYAGRQGDLIMLDYIIFMVPVMMLAMAASIYTQLTFKKYSKRRAASGMTGAEAASQLLSRYGISNVRIEPVRGFLSDHYDPRSRTLRLSPEVYASDSLSAIGVACHEAGHALQHAEHYAPLTMRSLLVPVASIGSNFAPLIIMVGAALGFFGLVKIGIFLFIGAVLFSIITLPVEWNASSRAKDWMLKSGIVSYEEQGMAAKVLNAAFMTYVAGAITAIATLLYYLMRLGLLGGRGR